MPRVNVDVAPEGTDPIASNIRMPHRRGGNREWLTVILMAAGFLAAVGWLAWTWFLKPAPAGAVSIATSTPAPTFTVTPRSPSHTVTLTSSVTATETLTRPVLTPILPPIRRQPTPDPDADRQWGTWASSWPISPTPTATATATEGGANVAFVPPARAVPSITEPTYTPYPTYTRYPTPAPMPTYTPPKLVLPPTYTPYPTYTAVPDTPTATMTPFPTATSTPTPAPVTLMGSVQVITGCQLSNLAIQSAGVTYYLLLMPGLTLPPGGDPTGWLAMATGYTTAACNGLALQTTGLVWLAAPTVTPTPTNTATPTATYTPTLTPTITVTEVITP